MVKIDYHGKTHGCDNAELIGYYWSYTLEGYAYKEVSKNRDRRREMLEAYIESQKLCTTDICDMAERVVKLNNRLGFPYGFDELYDKLEKLCKGSYYENNYKDTFNEKVIIKYMGINKRVYDILCYQDLQDADTKMSYKTETYHYEDILFGMGFDSEHGYQDQLIEDENGEWHRMSLMEVFLTFADNIPKAENFEAYGDDTPSKENKS